jgi:hypothetical protein
MRTWEHAEPEAFTKLIEGEASRDEARTIVRHLLAGCGRCQTRSLAAHKEVMATDIGSYDAAFDRVEELLLDRALSERAPARRVAYAAQRR